MATLIEIGARSQLEVIEEICRAGHLPVTQQPELRKLKQRLQTFNNLNQDLQNIAKQSDLIIQEAVTVMRLQLDSLKLASQDLTGILQTSMLGPECQQVEAQIFQTFVNRLEDGRMGADWITKSKELLINYASNTTCKQFPELNTSEQLIDDFKFSLKQFLEQVSFSLYYGTYEILDSPEIRLVFGIEQYKIAFQAMKEAISKWLRSETFQEIEACFDYLIERLQFY